jgi:hypothetical protein
MNKSFNFILKKTLSNKIIEIDYQLAVDFLLPRHYSGRTPNICKAFGWYINGELVAVCTFGKPASPALCIGVCGKEYADNVYELNRLCRIETLTEPLSKFVGKCLKELKKENWIIISYSDMAMEHHGYVYQASNFIYTGCTKERTDMYTEGNKHCRHYDEKEQTGIRKIRSPKHRYVYFCTSDRKLKKDWLLHLKYKIQPYPKGDNNPDYKLGDYLEPELVKIK